MSESGIAVDGPLRPDKTLDLGVPEVPVEARADSFAPRTPWINGFELIGPIGSGGQGTVWQAIRERDQVRVAVKIMRSTHTDLAHARARFNQGIATLSALEHPGIVRSIDSGVLPSGELWHATEYVSGCVLSEYVNDLDEGYSRERGRESRLPVQSLVGLFVQLVDAVEAAHRVGVIHRDIKPSNVIVNEAGKPVLLDFDLAKPPESERTALITLTGEFVGSPAYASPEQVQCRPGGIDVRTDIYSLGVMLYECLTGTFPYQVDGPLAKSFEQIQYAEPRPLRQHAPWIDRDLQSIVLKTIAKTPDQRYQSACELRTDLQRYLHGEAVTARGDRLGYVLSKFIRRHRVLTGSIAAGVVLSLAYGTAITVLYRRAAAAERRAVAHAADARSKFRILDPEQDRYIGGATRSGSLGSGQSYTADADLNIPFGLNGPYFVIVRADSNHAVFENGQEADNVRVPTGLTAIAIPPPADLVVASVTPPTDGVLGDMAHFTWELRNTSSQPINGAWKDSV